MHLFTIVENEFAILYCKGTYKQAKLYCRNKELYMQYGSGYVRLYKGGITSMPNVRWQELSLSDNMYRGDTFGKLSVTFEKDF